MAHKRTVSNITRAVVLLLWLVVIQQQLVTLCHAQETPSYYLNMAEMVGMVNADDESLSLLHYYRTNVCERQGQLLNDSMTLANALSGLELSVAIRLYPSELQVFSLDEEGQIPTQNPGLLVEFLDELASRAGFTWRNSFAVMEQLDNSLPNVTWSDVLEWEVSHFDVAVDDWYRTNDRRARGISFPRGFSNGGVVVGRDDTTVLAKTTLQFWSHFWPFESTVWCCILLLMVLTGTVYFVLEYGLPAQLAKLSLQQQHLEEESLSMTCDDNTTTDSMTHKTWMHQWMYSLFLCGLVSAGPYRVQPTTGPSRILCLSWGFVSLIMISGYTANLASAYVSRRTAPTIVSMADAIATGTPLCVHRGTPVDNTLTLDYPDLIIVRKDTVEQMFVALTQPWDEGGCYGVVSSLADLQQFQVQSQYNPTCTLTTNKEQVLPFSSGIATAVDTSIYCTSLISYVLDIHIRQMEADRFIENLWNRHLYQMSTNQCVFNADGSRATQLTEITTTTDVNDDSRFSLTFFEIGGIFITHSVVSVAVLVVCWLQYFLRQGEM